MNHIGWALIPEFPHPSIFEDLVLIPTPADLPRWLELYGAGDKTREAVNDVLKNGGDWDAIRRVIEPHESNDEDEYSDLYRQVVFRSLGTKEKIINVESSHILRKYLVSLRIFLNEYAFQPGHKTAIFKIFENADRSKLFKPWLICRYHISFCYQSLPFPAAKNYKLDRIVNMCKPLIGKHPFEPLLKRFDKEAHEKLLNEQIFYSQRFRLFDTWKWIQDEIEGKVDPTGMRIHEASLPFMLRRGSDKKAAAASKKAMKVEALKFGVEYESGGLILVQCFYCYQLREESFPSGNGVIHRYCSNCAQSEREFWKIWKK